MLLIPLLTYVNAESKHMPQYACSHHMNDFYSMNKYLQFNFPKKWNGISFAKINCFYAM